MAAALNAVPRAGGQTFKNDLKRAMPVGRRLATRFVLCGVRVPPDSFAGM